MSEAPSRSIRLFGTDSRSSRRACCSAGPLTAELEAGNLRYIRFSRRRDDLARSPSSSATRTGAPTIPAIANLESSRNAQTDSASPTAAVAQGRGPGVRLSSAEIAGAPTDRCASRRRGARGQRFPHQPHRLRRPASIAGVAGQSRRGHRDDHGQRLRNPVPRTDRSRAADDEPARDPHAFAPGAAVECRMEGDTFEMEDQRNWTDASYKTYVRPLALPWPYTLAERRAARAVRHADRIGRAAAGAERGSEIVRVRVGERGRRGAALGLGLDPDDARGRAGAMRNGCAPSASRISSAITIRVAATTARRWLASVESCAGARRRRLGSKRRRRRSRASRRRSRRSAETVRRPGLAVPGRAGVARRGSQMHAARQSLAALPAGRRALSCDAARLSRRLASAAECSATSPNSTASARRSPSSISSASRPRRSSMRATTGRSPRRWSRSPISRRSVRAIVGGKPYAVGPSAIGMRDNPYGQATMPNPDNIRQAMNRNDPRQRGLLAAAWSLGYFAHFAAGGARQIALGGGRGAVRPPPRAGRLSSTVVRRRGRPVSRLPCRARTGAAEGRAHARAERLAPARDPGICGGERTCGSPI